MRTVIDQLRVLKDSNKELTLSARSLFRRLGDLLAYSDVGGEAINGRLEPLRKFL